MNWHEFIISDDRILLGKPTIKGTRLSVELVLELLADGWTEQMLLESYPMLTKTALQAIFAYTKECIGNELYFEIAEEVV